MSALQWQQVDLEGGILTLVDSNAHTRVGVVRKKTKTDRDRKIALGQATVVLLTEHRERCQAKCKALKSKLLNPAAGDR